MIRRVPTLASFLLLLVAACSGGGDGGPPPQPSVIVAISANPVADATVGTALASAPTFEVRSATGTALANVPVTVAVASGNGQLAGAPTASLAGPTPIGTWTLGTTAGAQSVTVTVTGLTPLTFNITATAGAASTVTRVDGHNQFGQGGQAVAIAPTVRVRDQHQNNVSGATVNWAVTSGGGSVAAATSLSNANGIATAPTWTLGNGPSGEQTLTASLSGLNAVFSAFTGIAPASITAEVAAPATATVGTALGTPPAFAVRDSGGTAITGFPVTVTLTGGGGNLAGAPTATAAGSTAIGTWTMGTATGTQTVTVSAPGVATDLVFTVTATAGAVAQMQLVSGNGQSALAGDFVANPVLVRVRDQFGNPAPDRTISWIVTKGGGTLGAAQTTSNAQGESNSPAWRLGRQGGAQEITVGSNGFQQVATAAIQSNYTVELRYLGTEPAENIAAAFTAAANRIQAMIVGDVPDITVGGPLNGTPCGIGTVPAGTFDDVVIYARVEAIDGVGGTLGSAGPCFIRSNATQSTPSTIPPHTIVGSMRFDEADLANLSAAGRLEAVILHEMLHVIGVGTLWDEPNNALLANPCPSGTGVGANAPNGPCATQPAFTGAQGIAACQTTNGGTNTCATFVPVENCNNLNVTNCAGGTINSHWKESSFTTELMTGFISPTGTPNPLSAMTVMSLGDMSYTVNALAADPYTAPAGLQAGLVEAGGISVGSIRLPAPTLPRFGIDHSGRVRPIERK